MSAPAVRVDDVTRSELHWSEPTCPPAVLANNSAPAGPSAHDDAATLLVALCTRLGWRTLTDPLSMSERELLADVIDSHHGSGAAVRWWQPTAPPPPAVLRWSPVRDGSPVVVSHPALTRKGPTPGVVRGFDTVSARYLVALDGQPDPQWFQAFRVTHRVSVAPAGYAAVTAARRS